MAWPAHALLCLEDRLLISATRRVTTGYLANKVALLVLSFCSPRVKQQSLCPPRSGQPRLGVEWARRDPASWDTLVIGGQGDLRSGLWAALLSSSTTVTSDLTSLCLSFLVSKVGSQWQEGS